MFLGRFLKISAIILLAVILFYLGGEAGVRSQVLIDRWKTDRAIEKFNQTLAKMFQEDVYGGKTPEETYNLLVSALKNEDVDLAVKYIVLDAERRLKYQNEFNKMKAERKLKEYGEKLPAWKEWEQIKDNYNDWVERARVEYGQIVTEQTEIYDPYLKKYTTINPGVYGRSINFVKNSNNIWKIESL